MPSRPRNKGARFSTWEYKLHTLNVNSWSSFKAKLDDSHLDQMLQHTTIMLIQEHKILEQSDLDEAVQYCARRGWQAVFGAARRMESGLASGGVAILVRDGMDVGVTRVDFDYGELAHRLLALRIHLQVDGLMSYYPPIWKPSAASTRRIGGSWHSSPLSNIRRGCQLSVGGT